MPLSADAYGPAARPIVSPWIEPERDTLYSARHIWPYIRFLSVTVILGLAGAQAFGLMGALGLTLGYALWLAGVSRFGLLARLPGWESLIRHVLMLVGIGALMFLARSRPEASAPPLFWLLLLIPVLTVGVELSRPSAILVIGAAALLPSLPAVLAILQGNPPAGLSAVSLVGEGLKSAIIAFVGFSSYITSRSLAYQQRLNQRLVELLPKIAAHTDWEDAAQTAVCLTAALLGRPKHPVVVNLLVVNTSTSELRMFASSSPGGQRLAAQDYRFALGLGITGWVASTGRPCFLNDIAHDPQERFMAHEAFHEIKAEIAVPVGEPNQVVAVLDVEAQRTNAFDEEDLHALQLIASQLLETYHQTRTLGTQRKLADLSSKLARRLISLRDLGAILQEVGGVAMEVLEADLIGYYVKDPMTEKISGPYYAGELHFPELMRKPEDISPGGRVQRLIEMGGIHVFPNAQTDPMLVQREAWHAQSGRAVFVRREQILSSASVVLQVGSDVVGLMFVNYRRLQSFPQELVDLFDILAPLAALAIQSCTREAAAEIVRRERLRRDLHDTIAHRLLLAERAVTQLTRSTPGSTAWNEAEVEAMYYIRSADRTVKNLVQGLEFFTLQSILEDMVHHARRIETASGIRVVTEINGPVPERPLVIWAGNQILFAAEEALFNAMRHSHATRIDLGATLHGAELELCIRDNGEGFDERRIKPGMGLGNLRHRIKEFLQGRIVLNTAPGQGTEIRMWIPLPVEPLKERELGNGRDD